MLEKPPHDDIKDALTAAIDICIPPRGRSNSQAKTSNIIYHGRFGGVAA
jgi:hypothetical protein